MRLFNLRTLLCFPQPLGQQQSSASDSHDASVFGDVCQNDGRASESISERQSQASSAKGVAANLPAEKGTWTWQPRVQPMQQRATHSAIHQAPCATKARSVLHTGAEAASAPATPFTAASADVGVLEELLVPMNHGCCGTTATQQHAVQPLPASPSSSWPLPPAAAAAAHMPDLRLSSPALYTDLMEQSPFFMTAVAMDGSRVYQSPLSIGYYGDLSSSAWTPPPGGSTDGQEARLLPSLLKTLFSLEAEPLLLEMLHTVLQGGNRVAQDCAWRRVMRVPASCRRDATAAEPVIQRDEAAAPAACAGAAPSASTGDEGKAGRSRQAMEGMKTESTLKLTGCQAHLLHCATRMSAEFARASSDYSRASTPRSLASVTEGVEQRRDSKGLAAGERGSSSFTDAASAVSVAARNAPKRMRSLLDRSHHGGQSFTAGRSMLAHPARKMSLDSAWNAGSPDTHLGALPAAGARAWVRSASVRPASNLSSTVANKCAEPSAWEVGKQHRSAGVPSLGGSEGAVCSLETLEREDSLDGVAACDRSSSSNPASSTAPDPASQRGAVPVEAREEWHEIFVKTGKDAEGRHLLLIYQTDVTVRTQLETTMANLTEMQLNTLCQIFPRHVIEFLSTARDTSVPANLGHLARSHEDVSVLFMDIVGFTSMSKQVAPNAVMTFLNSLFSVFDELCTLHNVHKVETAGDCYIVSSGLLSVDSEGFAQVTQDHDPEESAANIFAFARDMLIASREVLMPHDNSPVTIRVGIHTGPCVSGVVGSKLPKFGIFGDTMNTASRMESTCTPGRIQVSSFTHSLLMASGLSRCEEWEAMGEVEVKGKGLMRTFQWLEQPSSGSPGIPSFASKAFDSAAGHCRAEQGMAAEGSLLFKILQSSCSQEGKRVVMRPPCIQPAPAAGPLKVGL